MFLLFIMCNIHNVGTGSHQFRTVNIDTLPAEVLLVSLFILLLEAGHVVGHVDAEDVLTVNVSVQLLALVVVSWEPLLGVGNVHSSVNSSLQGSENLRERTFIKNVRKMIILRKILSMERRSGSLNHNFHMDCQDFVSHPYKLY